MWGLESQDLIRKAIKDQETKQSDGLNLGGSCQKNLTCPVLLKWALPSHIEIALKHNIKMFFGVGA